MFTRINPNDLIRMMKTTGWYIKRRLNVRMLPGLNAKDEQMNFDLKPCVHRQYTR